MTSNAQAAADFAAAYAKRYPDKPAPAVRLYAGNRFEVREGYAARTLARRDMLRETAQMFTQAALGGGKK